MRVRSLRTRLWLIGALGALFASASASWGLGEAFARATLATFESRLQDDLLTLSGLLVRDPDGFAMLRREPTDERYARPLSGHYWRVETGRVQYRSRSLWDTELKLPDGVSASGIRFLALPGPLDQRLRVALQRIRIAGIAEPVTVIVASDAAEVHARIRDFRWYAGLSAAGLVVLLLGVVAYQVEFGLKPLRGIAATLARVRAGEHPRLDAAAMPEEVRPLAIDLNGFLDHHERMVQRARNASSNLAHGLKTPLAVLAAAAGDPATDDLRPIVLAQVERMQAGIDRQLAVASVADARSRAAVAGVAEQLVALMRRVHADRAPDIALDVPSDVEFQGERIDLEEMLGNLLDNACKWARHRVTLEGRVHGGRIEVVVSDDGPGMDPAAGRAALQRGVRLDERVAGSGLGLAIVVDLATSYGGTLDIGRSPLGGVAARLELPAAS